MSVFIVLGIYNFRGGMQGTVKVSVLVYVCSQPFILYIGPIRQSTLGKFYKFRSIRKISDKVRVFWEGHKFEKKIVAFSEYSNFICFNRIHFVIIKVIKHKSCFFINIKQIFETLWFFYLAIFISFLNRRFDMGFNSKI